MSSSLLEKFCVKNQIPQFIQKLNSILQKVDFQSIISWTLNNQIFIKDIKKLQKVVLKQYFRHNKIQSFVRQLNMYGFHKIPKNEKQKNQVYFKNDHFEKDNIQCLTLIKRRKKNNKGITQQLQQKKQKRINQISQSKKIIKDYVQIIQCYIQMIKKNNPNIPSDEFHDIMWITNNMINNQQSVKIENPKCIQYYNELQTVRQFLFKGDIQPLMIGSKCSIENEFRY